MTKYGKLSVLDIGPEQRDNVHGTAKKGLIVLHETVSPDYPGWADVKQTSQYLDNKDYGIHGVVDLEGNKAFAIGLGRAIFYHTQSGSCLVNTRGIGIELVSRVMLVDPDNTDRWNIWIKRTKQIDETAKLVATIARFHGIPLQIASGLPLSSGVTTHWQVTKNCGIQGGHVDCWPRHLGGYFPLRRVVAKAQMYQKLGY